MIFFLAPPEVFKINVAWELIGREAKLYIGFGCFKTAQKRYEHEFAASLSHKPIFFLHTILRLCEVFICVSSYPTLEFFIFQLVNWLIYYSSLITHIDVLIAPRRQKKIFNFATSGSSHFGSFIIIR